MVLPLYQVSTALFIRRLSVISRPFILKNVEFSSCEKFPPPNRCLDNTILRRTSWDTNCSIHTFHHFLALGNPVWRNQFLSFSSKEKKSKSKQKATRRAADTDDESDYDSDDSDFEEDDDDPANIAKKDWKDLKLNVPSLRIDVVLSTGLGVSRKKIEDAFLDAKLRHNGKKVMKKSRQVQEGDILDVIKESQFTNKEGNQVMLVMRVEMKKIKEEKTSSDRTRVKLRRWKHLELPREK